MDPELVDIIRREIAEIREELAMLNRYFRETPDDFQMRTHYQERSHEMLLKMTLLLDLAD